MNDISAATSSSDPATDPGAFPTREDFFSVLRCPNCELDTLDPHRRPVECTACGATYDTAGGVLNLAEKGFKSIEQRVYALKWYAENYEKGREQLTYIRSGRTLEAEMALSAQFLNLKADSRLLDVACGTATFTRYFAKKILEKEPKPDSDGPLIMGTDLSQASLEQGFRYLQDEGLEKQVFLFRSDAASLPVEHQAFNRVHCSAALHAMGDDIDRVLRHFARLLEPKGICVISTWLVTPEEDDEDFDVFRWLAGQAQAFINRNLHKFEVGELESRMEKAGFKISSVSTSQEQITVKGRRVR